MTVLFRTFADNVRKWAKNVRKRPEMSGMAGLAHTRVAAVWQRGDVVDSAAFPLAPGPQPLKQKLNLQQVNPICKSRCYRLRQTSVSVPVYLNL